MQQAVIYLEDEQLRALEHLADAEHQSVEEMVRRAVDVYLSQRFADDDAWRARLDQLVSRIQSQIPDSVSSDEIEADITAARLEAKQARRVARGR